MALNRCHTIDDLRARARRRLPGAIFDFLDGGAETEQTMRRNTAAFEDLTLVPRCLTGVAELSTATHVLGTSIAWPVIGAPTGASRLFHPEGELAVARAFAAAGTIYSLSTGSTFSLERVAAECTGAKLFQLYVYRDRGMSRSLIERAKAAGYRALCLTVDTAVVGKRERDLRSGFTIPPRFGAASLAGFALRPGWLIGQARAGRFTFGNIVADGVREDGFVEQSKSYGDALDPAISWQDVRDIAAQWGGPFAIKGLLAADDAREAAANGATAIIVSNHGGRQLDGALAAIDALPRIADAIGDTLELIVDGGIRRGSHVLKAIALGARACMIGRPYLYGLAAGGEPGVARALAMLREEFETAMRLCGCRDVARIGRDLVDRPARRE